MNIQIFGKRSCFDTQKAERYFKERHIPFQSINLIKDGLSKGEMLSVRQAVGFAAMVDSGSKEYGRLNMAYLGNSPAAEEVLLNNPGLYRTPIVRNGRQATVGYQPDIWKQWQ